MSITDLKRNKLRQTLAECKGFSFRQGLIEAFQIDGQRTACMYNSRLIDMIDICNPIKAMTIVPQKQEEKRVIMEPIIISFYYIN